MTRDGQLAIETRAREVWARRDYQAAAGVVVEAYGPQILGYLVRTMRNQADAVEVFSAFCEDLCRGLPKFEARSSFWTWAYRVATRARDRYWREPYRRRGGRLATDALGQLEQEVRSKTLSYLKTEVKDRFAALRERLTPEEQSLLTLRVDKDMSWAEIAEVLAEEPEPITEAALRNTITALRQRFQRLKDKLRRVAQEEGLLQVDRPEGAQE